MDPLTESADTAYYDFWPGRWFEDKGGVVDTSGSRFTILSSIHPAAFEERWRLVLQDGTELNSTALRAWDKTTRRWMYTWVSDNGLYQGGKDHHGWWIYRHFYVDGDRYLWPAGIPATARQQRTENQPDVLR